MFFIIYELRLHCPHVSLDPGPGPDQQSSDVELAVNPLIGTFPADVDMCGFTQPEDGLQEVLYGRDYWLAPMGPSPISPTPILPQLRSTRRGISFQTICFYHHCGIALPKHQMDGPYRRNTSRRFRTDARSRFKTYHGIWQLES